MGSPRQEEDGHASVVQELSNDNTPGSRPLLPSAPDPSTDPGIVPSITTPLPDEDTFSTEMNIFVLTPVAALKMLCASIDALVKLTGDVPPTPPLRSRNSSPSHALVLANRQRSTSKENMAFTTENHRSEVPHTPIGSPEAHETEPVRIVGMGAEPIYLQQGALARKFYSKKPPPISTEDYLMRMHRYCPMSTAVYLGTSYYIKRLAVVDRLIPVTPRNVHRLLLAGLRVAMKALEDLSYPHHRFAKVGGVSEAELARLEVSFCYLINFDLRVNAAILQQEASSFQNGGLLGNNTISTLTLKPVSPKSEKRSPAAASAGLPTRTLATALEASS